MAAQETVHTVEHHDQKQEIRQLLKDVVRDGEVVVVEQVQSFALLKHGRDDQNRKVEELEQEREAKDGSDELSCIWMAVLHAEPGDEYE
jgi:hypothetical protein